MTITDKAVNSIKKLGLNMVEHANSGHTGIILGASQLMYAIYHEAKVNPKQPDWFNRDRVVLSSGHGSAMLYATLHLMGYDITLDDMRDFRTLGSITPGHPEIDITPGVDCSTGALGQGFANAVGMAMAESHLAAKYNRPKLKLIDHYTYVLCGDGDLMEGISYESASIAGKLKLNKLIVLYDSNNISLDAPTSVTTVEDTKMRFEAMRWNVLECDNNTKNIIEAIKLAKKDNDGKPTIIICKTIIGQGTKYANSEKCHAIPFKENEYSEVISNMGLDTTPFSVDADVYTHFKDMKEKSIIEYTDWKTLLSVYKKVYKKEYKQLFEPDLNAVADKLNNLKWNYENGISTRDAGHIILNEMGKHLSNLFGGCADLSKSTKACFDNEGFFDAQNKTNRNIAFGVREHAMSAICNGLCLHGGLRSFASTFLIFSDYMRYAMRMSSLMDLPVLYLLTHDSIAVGQDGATHEPVEQIASMRLIPNLRVFRPADAKEAVGVFQWYLTHRTPTVIAMSRQSLPILDKSSADNVSRGAYIVSKEPEKELNAILIATGSEVDIAIRTQKLLHKEGYSVRVVSMPCRGLFKLQSQAYREKVLPSYFPSKVVIEAGVSNGWEYFAGKFGKIIGVNTFGESGTQAELYDLFGICVANISKEVKELVKTNKTKNIDL